MISDFSPLFNVTSLKVLILENHYVKNVSFLRNLNFLKRLQITSETLQDVSGLQHLENLEDMVLAKCKIKDYSPIGKLDLSILELHYCEVNDLAFLSKLSRLKGLALLKNEITDISDLKELINLEHLAILKNPVSDISSLVDLVNLRWLDLWKDNISDIFSLVQNNGLGRGDIVFIDENPLNGKSINEYIPILRQRGVDVYYSDINPLNNNLRFGVKGRVDSNDISSTRILPY